MDKNRFTELVNLYLLEKVTDREGAELAGMLQLPVWQEEFERVVQEQLDKRTLDLEDAPQTVYDRIQARLDAEVGARQAQAARVVELPRRSRGLHYLRSPFLRWTAAALIIAVAGIYLFERSQSPELLPQAQRFKNDLPPGGRRAMLILADGRQIRLTGSQIGTPIEEAAAQGAVHITTGEGETYSLTLSDGTRVWLNSSSSLSYPVTFTGGRRRVQLSGEGYFEVRHDAHNPFSVQLPDGSLVKDLGTRFNIHAYADESAIKTTVLEGAVQVEVGGKELSLKPGEQAEHSAKEALTVHEEGNLKTTIAWKDDQFLLEATNLRAIMKQVERWYGAEVIYKDSMQNDTTEFFGSLPRDVPVSELLRTMESTGRVHFIIEGKKITVMK